MSDRLTKEVRDEMRRAAKSARDFVPMQPGESRTIMASLPTVPEGVRGVYLPATNVIALLDERDAFEAHGLAEMEQNANLETELAALRDLTRAMADALEPFAEYEPSLRHWKNSYGTIRNKWGDCQPVLQDRQPIEGKDDVVKIVSIYAAAFRTAARVLTDYRSRSESTNERDG